MNLLNKIIRMLRVIEEWNVPLLSDELAKDRSDIYTYCKECYKIYKKDVDQSFAYCPSKKCYGKNNGLMIAYGYKEAVELVKRLKREHSVSKQ